MTPYEDSTATLISRGVDRAKLGEARAVYEEIAGMGAAIPERSHYAFGWILYYALHQASEDDILWRKRLLTDYLKLHTPRPHKLHSMVLTEAIRLRDDTIKAEGYPRRKNIDTSRSFSIVRFLPLWDTVNLRPGDWTRHQLNDRPLSSTVEKLITAYAGEIEKTRERPHAYFIAVIDRALHEYPDNCNLLCQRALLYSLDGDAEKATALLKTALLLAPGKYHIWTRLAMLVDPDTDPKLKMALLARALSAPGKADFKGRIRLGLAEIWLTRNCFAQAAWELQQVRHLYESNQWHLPRKYTTLIEKIPTGTVTADTKEAYSELLLMADEFIYTSLPSIAAKKTYHKNPQPSGSIPSKWKSSSEYSWRATDEAGNNYWFQPQRYGIDPTLPLGTSLRIRLINGRLVHAHLDVQK